MRSCATCLLPSRVSRTSSCITPVGNKRWDFDRATAKFQHKIYATRTPGAPVPLTPLRIRWLDAKVHAVCCSTGFYLVAFGVVGFRRHHSDPDILRGHAVSSRQLQLL